MSKILTHLVFDTETISTEPNATILALACVPFTFENYSNFPTLLEKGIMVKFNVEEQVKLYKRSIEKSTIDFWKEQEKEVRDSMVKPSKNDFSVVEGLEKINNFIENIDGFSKRNSYAWSRGTDFDFPIIRSLYSASGVPIPYNHWKVRDVRTAIDIMSGTDDGQYEIKSCSDGFKKHNPLHDAAMDAARLIELYHLNSGEEIPF